MSGLCSGAGCGEGEQSSGRIFIEVDNSRDLMSSSWFSSEWEEEKRWPRKRSSMPALNKLLYITNLAIKSSSSVLDLVLSSS